jgi:hypothetical protein
MIEKIRSYDVITDFWERYGRDCGWTRVHEVRCSAPEVTCRQALPT